MIAVIFDIFLYLYFATVLVAAVMGTYYRKALHYPLNWLWVYLWLDIGVELMVLTLRKIEISFMWLYNAFGPIEYFFISWLYISYSKSALSKNIIRILFILYTLFVTYHLVFLNGFNEYNIVFLSRSMLMAMLTLYFFLKIYRSNEILEINRSPLFWLSAGLFLFCTGSLFSMGLGSSIMRLNSQLGYLVYLLNPILNIYLYIMFTVSFLCSRRNPKYY